jgi:hypothetical protein
MLIYTIFTCEKCGEIIMYDSELQCYLMHDECDGEQS